MLETEKSLPIYIKVNSVDNVAIIVNNNGLEKGAIFQDGLKLIDNIPEGHKVALVDIDKDSPIIRYGETIGYAKGDIKQGSWVDQYSIVLAEAQDMEEYQLATKVPEGEPSLEGYTFMGYRNVDGTVGTKNILGITTTVQCVEGVINLAEKKIREELLPKYKNVDDIMVLNHNYGCGVAINAKDAEIPIRTIKNMAYNPNFGGEMLVIGLGCEKLLPEMLFSELPDENLVVLQECHGFSEMISEIVTRAEDKLKRLDQRRREECPVSDLVVGIQCGGSDAFSGVTANPALGYTVDLLVRAGAKVMFSEVTEIRDAVHLLTPRAESVEVAKKLIEEMKWYDNYLDKGGVDRDANPSPGNKVGGLANVIDKALGSVAKSGSSKIVDVLSPGERIRKSGLTYAATPASDFVCGTLQFASGMTMQVFTTGRGTTYNLAVAPVIKVSTNNTLAEKWNDLIDVNAGKISTGQATIEEVGWEIFNLIIEVASGRKKTYSDIYGIFNALCLFNPGPVT